MEQQEHSIFEELEQNKPFTHATTGQRFVHFLIDTIVLGNLGAAVIWFLIGIIMVLSGSSLEETTLLDESFKSKLFSYLIGAISIVLTSAFIEGITKGRSLGKLITKTKVVREDRQPITWEDAFLRAVSRIVPFEPFSALGGHPWHDTWTKTMVVKKD